MQSVWLVLKVFMGTIALAKLPKRFHLSSMNSRRFPFPPKSTTVTRATIVTIVEPKPFITASLMFKLQPTLTLGIHLPIMEPHLNQF